MGSAKTRLDGERPRGMARLRGVEQTARRCTGVADALVRPEHRNPSADHDLLDPLGPLRRAMYDPLTSTNPTSGKAQALAGSPTARCEYSAPIKSKTSPAYAHSLSRRTPGARMVMTPSVFALPRNGRR